MIPQTQYIKRGIDGEYNLIKNIKNQYKDYEFVKPFCYHGTKRNYISAIIKKGLYPSGGIYGTAIYTKLQPHKTIGYYYGNNALICIYLPHAKPRYVLERKRDWILFPKIISSKTFLFALIIEYVPIEIPYIRYLEKYKGVPIYLLEVKDNENIEVHSKQINGQLGNIAAHIIKSKGLSYNKKVKIQVIEKI